MLTYGKAPVPDTTEWSAETDYFIGTFKGQPALCQPRCQEGRPAFGKQHFVRQRQAVYQGRCDLCGRPLRDRTKFSLSEPLDGNLQVEPLLHRECAEISIGACPHLQKGHTLRRITRYRVILDMCDPRPVIPEYNGPPVIGYALIEVLA